MSPLNKLLTEKQEKMYALDVFNEHLEHAVSGKRCFLVMEGMQRGLEVPAEKAQHLVENAIESVSEDLSEIEMKLDAINVLLDKDYH
jgi:hypothetical protein